jgi:hypothetical protein
MNSNDPTSGLLDQPVANPAARDPHPSQRLRPHAKNRAAELSLTSASNRRPSHPEHAR